MRERHENKRIAKVFTLAPPSPSAYSRLALLASPSIAPQSVVVDIRKLDVRHRPERRSHKVPLDLGVVHVARVAVDGDEAREVVRVARHAEERGLADAAEADLSHEQVSLVRAEE